MSPTPFEDAVVLILGVGPRAKRARQLLASQGVRLASRFSGSVTYVVVDRGVPRSDPAVQAAARAAIPVVTTAELQKWPGMESIGETSPGVELATYSTGFVPPPPVLRAPPPSQHQWLSIVWPLVSVFTAGMAMPAITAYAAYKLRSAMLALFAGGYAAVLVTFFVASAGATPGVFLPLAAMAWLGVWFGSPWHAYFLGVRMRESATSDPPPPPKPVSPAIAAKERANDAALAEYEHVRDLRRRARELVESDPAAATALHVGRPDLPGKYDDGGLVDVNNVPESVLTSLPGVDEEVAGQIVRLRTTSGQISSVDEILIHTDLDPGRLDELREIALFRD